METLSSDQWADSQHHEEWFWHTQREGGNTEQIARNDYYTSYIFPQFFFNTSLADKVLVDVGSGPEGILHVLEAKRKVAIDPLMKQFREMGYPVNSGDVETYCMPGEDLDVLDFLADVAFCLNALDHAKDPGRVLDHIHNLLVPGGKLLLVVDMREVKDLDVYHKLSLDHRSLRNELSGYSDVDQWIVPHQKPNPVRQFVAVCTK